jgi:hypothetical protein
LSAFVPKGYKSQIIINELNIDWKKPVVICEGFVDMLKSVTNTVPLFGKSMSQQSKLFESIVLNDTPVYLALDADAKKDAQKLAKSFISYDVSCYNIDVEPYKDIGEMNHEQFQERYNSAKLLNKMDLLRERIRSL